MEFSYRPGVLRSPQVWTVDAGKLTGPKQQDWDLSSVTLARYVDIPVKGRWNAELLLKRGEEKLRLICNDRARGEDRFHFMLLVLAIVRELKAHCPDLLIQRGQGRLANIAFASIGLIPAGFGLSILWDSLSLGGDAFGIGMGLFMLALAAFLVWCAAPWKPAQQESPEAFEVWLRGWIAASTGQTVTA